MSNSAKIVCNNVWKVFGDQPERTLQDLDPSLSRAQVQEQTGHVIAVKDASFEVQQGETFVVMGLSGSGKSTLVRCITRLIEPTAGQILIDGDDVVGMNKSQLTDLRRHKMSMVFQHFGLLPHRRVVDNVAYGLEVQGVAKRERIEKAVEMLDLVGLSGWEENYPRELSGGMQQRVGLARAMAVDPEILLFDEPFSALDPLIRRDMQDELLRIQDLVKKTMIFITHDFLEAIKMGDHIAIMKDGEFSQIGTAEELISAPADDYVREFTEEVPRYKVLSAGTVMTPAACVVSNGDGLDAIQNQIRSGGHSAAFVTDGEGRFEGTVESGEPGNGSGDLAAVLAGSTPAVAQDVKLEHLIKITADCDVPVAVVDGANKLVGTIDRKTILLAMQTRD